MSSLKPGKTLLPLKKDYEEVGAESNEDDDDVEGDDY